MKNILILITLLCLTTSLVAQRNYKEAIEFGDSSFKDGNFGRAIDFYFAAEAFDETKKEAVKAKVDAVFDKINEIKDAAIMAKKAAEVAKEKSQQAETEAKTEKIQAEEAKAIAEKEKVKALLAKAQADKQTEKALQAKTEAEAQREKAMRAEKLAMNKANEAQKLKEQAEQILAISRARVQANNSLRVIAEGKLAKGTAQALGASAENKKAGGPTYNKDVYQALDASYRAFEKEEQKKKGNKNASPINQIQNSGIRCISTIHHPSRREITAFAMDNKTLVILENGKKSELELADRPRSMAFSADGNLLLIGTLSGQVLAFQYEKGKYSPKTLTIPNQGGVVHFIQNIPQKDNVAAFVFANKNAAYIGTIQNNKPTKKDKNQLVFKQYQQLKLPNLSNAAISQDGQYFLSSNLDTLVVSKLSYTENKVDIIKMATKELESPISAAAIGKDKKGNYLFALGFKNGRVKLASLDSLNCLISDMTCSSLPLEHNIEIKKILFNQDASQMVTASLDHTAKLWNLTNRGEDRIPLVGHRSWIWDMTYTPDEKQILTVSEDRLIRVWFAELKDLEKIVQTLKQ